MTTNAFVIITGLDCRQLGRELSIFAFIGKSVRLGARLLLLIRRRRDSALGFKSIVDHLENERDRHVNLRAIDEEGRCLAYLKLDTRTDTCILYSGVLLLYAGPARPRQRGTHDLRPLLSHRAPAGL
jgi:hypothetical protein